jgi:hypothetical protein
MEPLPETDEALNEYLEDGDWDLRAVLTTMARDVRQIVPSCVGLSLTLVPDDLTFTLVATDAEIAAIDTARSGLHPPQGDVGGEAEVSDLDLDDLFDEERWTTLARASAARGIESSLSLQVLADHDVLGDVDLYAARAGAFAGKHARLAGVLGAVTEGAVSDADLEFASREAARRAPRILADVRLVDVAVGMLAARYHTDVGEARVRLEGAAGRAGASVVQAAVVVIQSHLE